jgi:hypothetical protein
MRRSSPAALLASSAMAAGMLSDEMAIGVLGGMEQTDYSGPILAEIQELCVLCTCGSLEELFIAHDRFENNSDE